MFIKVSNILAWRDLFFNCFFLVNFFADFGDDENNYWGLNVELDSELHNPEKDKIRDEYLEKIGIKVFRLRNFEKEAIQKKEFHDLTALIRSMTPTLIPRQFSFSDNIRLKKGI